MQLQLGVVTIFYYLKSNDHMIMEKIAMPHESNLESNDHSPTVQFNRSDTIHNILCV